MTIKRLMTLAMSCAMLSAPAYLAAQQDQDVAAAARKAQEAKKNAPKAKMTLDNDNLDTLKGVVNTVGPTPTAPDDKTKSAPKTGAKSPANDEAYWRQKFADANKKLADDSRELDVTQREYNLKQQQFYTDPMASLKQDYSRQDLNDSKAKIDDLTARVEQDKTDISNLEDDLRKAGGEPGWASGPTRGTEPTDSSTEQPSTPAPAAEAPAGSAPPAQ